MTHYVIIVMGKDVRDAHEQGRKEIGMTGPILNHGGLETFTYISSVFPITFLEWLSNGRDVNYDFKQVRDSL